MKKLLLPALLLAGAASYANAEEVVLFSEDFNWIEPWCSAKVVDNIGNDDHSTSTPQTQSVYVLDEEFGDENGKFWLRNALQNSPEKGGKGYWCKAVYVLCEKDENGKDIKDENGNKIYIYDENGNHKWANENNIMGANSYYFGRYFLKFGKTDYQCNFRFDPALTQEENFVKEIGTPCTFTFDWCPWRQGNGTRDAVRLYIQIQEGNATIETIDEVTHSLEAGTPLEWIPATIDLTDFEITPNTHIYIQPAEEMWNENSVGVHRWCLDNLKVVYGEAEGGNEGEGNVWYSEDFNKMFEPWYDLLSLTDPVGTNDTTGDLGVALTDDTKAADGRRMKHAFMDQTLVTAADENHFCSNNGFLCWILDGKVHASYYVYRVHKGYIRFGVDNILGGVCLPSVTIPEDAENVYFEFDWCPTKNANGEYSEAVLQVAQQDEAAIFIPEIRHNMQTGDPYAWKHECFSLYDDCDNFTPNTLRFLISTAKAAGFGWPEGDELNKGDGKKVDASFYLDNIRISDKPTTGVNNIAIEDNSNAPVEYFNLQGVRVANPENGLYIRRQGNKATKIFVR